MQRHHGHCHFAIVLDVAFLARTRTRWLSSFLVAPSPASGARLVVADISGAIVLTSATYSRLFHVVYYPYWSDVS